MLFGVVIIACLLLAARLADKYKKDITETIGVSAAVLILALYVLAFFKGLRFAGGVSLVYIGYVSADLFYKKEQDKVTGYLRAVLSPEMILFILSVAVVGFMTRDRLFTWWDDINYWSSDAKQLFFMNGFTDRYGNVSPEFGDYPPVTSLAKWLFLQISPGAYKESLQFAGYFALNAVFLMPLLGRIKKSVSVLETPLRAAVITLMFACVMMFPGVFNGMIFYGTPADITMAIIYGVLLLSIYDRNGTDPVYYYLSIALYVAVLLLTKSVGFEWALFALIFYMMIASKERGIIFSILFGGGVYISWLLLCLMNRRIAKLTGAGIKMATSGTYTAPDNTLDKMRYFAEGFFLMPMHADRNPTLDIPTGAAVLLIILGLMAMALLRLVSAKEMRKLLIFTCITGLIAYGIVFLAHISIFQTEDQYLDAYAMSLSIARYCAPFTLGMAYLLLGISFEKVSGRSYKAILTMAGVWTGLILLTADYRGMYSHLYGYRAELDNDRAYIYDMVTDDGRVILQKTGDKELWGKRVLVLRSADNNSFVHNAYISKAASPVALVYDAFMPGDDGDIIIRKIKESHAEYFYVEDSAKEAAELIFGLSGGEKIEAGKVYRVDSVAY